MKVPLKLACAGLLFGTTVPVIVANPSPLGVTAYDPATPLSTLTNALVKPGTGLTVVGSSFVGQNGQASDVQMAAGQQAFVVCRLGEGNDSGGWPGRVEHNAAEGVAEEVA